MNYLKLPLLRLAIAAHPPKPCSPIRCIATGLLMAAFTGSAHAQTISAPYNASYSLINLGSVPGVPTNYGGVVFKAGDLNTLLIGGNANTSNSAIYSIAVTRGTGGHITGFSGSSTLYATAPGLSGGGIDGGLAYGPNKVLCYTTFADNTLGEIKFGSTSPDKLINLTPLGISSSTGTLNFVPSGQPGAGRLKIASYNASTVYDTTVTTDAGGTFSVAPVSGSVAAGNGPEGIVYVPLGSPLFSSPASLLSNYGANEVDAYDVSGTGDPLDATSRPFITGLTGALGAAFDPLTGDFVFSTFGATNRVIVVRGFVPPTPLISVSDVAITEGDTGSKNATFTVNLSGSSDYPATVDYSVVGGTATEGTDFTGSTGTLTFTPGNTSQTITVPIIGDTLDEADETFFVNLTNSIGARFGDKQAIGTITDNDPLPSLSISDATVTEGDAGTVNATFNVTLSPVSGRAVTVKVATGTPAVNPATAGVDYVSVPLTTLTFNPGVTSKTVTVQVKGDTLDEVDERFSVNLSAATNATVVDGQGIGTITDNDPPAVLTINDLTFNETTGPVSNAFFTVTLSPVSGKTVSINYTTADGTAKQPGDYNPGSGTIVFLPGQTTKTISVGVKNDDLDEDSEFFKINLSGVVNAVIGDNQGVCTIVDNDTSTISINDVTLVESDSGPKNLKFTVSLSNPSSKNITVDYATADNTATAGSDYVATAGTVILNPGQTIKTFIVESTGDLLDENNETFFVNLSNSINAGISDAQGVGTINDDDLAPTLSISDVSIAEGNSGTTNAVFTVTLSEVSGRSVSVNFATANGSATAGTDYNALTGTVTFAPGQTSKSIAIGVKGDTTAESDETFKVNLSGAVGANIADNQGVGTITNDDGAAQLFQDDEPSLSDEPSQ